MAADAALYTGSSLIVVGVVAVSWSSARCWPARSASAVPRDCDHLTRQGRGARRRHRGRRGDRRVQRERRLPGQRGQPRDRGCASPGSVSIVQLNPSASSRSASTLGTARVAWLAGGSTAARSVRPGSPRGQRAVGFHVELLTVSRRIAGGADCPTIQRGQTGGALAPRDRVRGALRSAGRARAPAGARGAAAARSDGPARAAGSRDCSASGSGIPPRGGVGGIGGSFGPAAPAVVDSRRPSGARCWARRRASAGNSSTATQPSPSRCTPAIQSNT